MKVISVTDGFSADLDKLIEQFCKTSSSQAKFAQFAQCWKQLRFQLIFHAFQQQNRLHEFLDNVYLILLERLRCSVSDDSSTSQPQSTTPQTSLLQQSALLFTLYSFYFKHPTLQGQPRIRIRALSSHLPAIRTILSQLRDGGHLEPVFCWHQLLSASAVHFVYSAQLWGPWFKARNRFSIAGDLSNRQQLVPAPALDRTFQSHLQSLSNFQRDYSKMKQNVAGGPSTEEIRQLDSMWTLEGEGEGDVFQQYLDKLKRLKASYEKPLEAEQQPKKRLLEESCSSSDEE